MMTLVVIPARYASTRFPGKPLALLGGKPVVQHVWERAHEADGVDKVVVATDDVRIADSVAAFAGQGVAMMTAATHQSGTDRCGEVVDVLEAQGLVYDVVVNLQGDEPFVSEADIKALTACFTDDGVQVATLRQRIANSGDLVSPNCVKVVCAADGRALYFSRCPVPYLRDVPQEQWLAAGIHYKHIGMYAFRPQVLKKLCRLPQSPLEKGERLEQLRWLEAGYSIATAMSSYDGVGIDTPDDLARAELRLKNITLN